MSDPISDTTTYNPRSHWSEDDLMRTFTANRDRISDVQRELDSLFTAQSDVEAEMARMVLTDESLLLLEATKPIDDRADSQTTAPPGREWLVIDASTKHAVFAPADTKKPRGYIPRDVAEQLLGRDLGGVVWFTRVESDAMRKDPEWRAVEP